MNTGDALILLFARGAAPPAAEAPPAGKFCRIGRVPSGPLVARADRVIE